MVSCPTSRNPSCSAGSTTVLTPTRCPGSPVFLCFSKAFYRHRQDARPMWPVPHPVSRFQGPKKTIHRCLHPHCPTPHAPSSNVYAPSSVLESTSFNPKVTLFGSHKLLLHPMPASYSMVFLKSGCGTLLFDSTVAENRCPSPYAPHDNCSLGSASVQLNLHAFTADNDAIPVSYPLPLPFCIPPQFSLSSVHHS